MLNAAVNIKFFTPDGSEIALDPMSVNIEADVNALTSTAIITIPYEGFYKRSIKDKNLSKIKVIPDVLQYKISDKEEIFLIAKETYVTISMGFNNTKYYNDTFDEFRGVIAGFRREGDVISIYCEDPMYFLKTAKFNFSFKANTLFEVMKHILTLGGFTVEQDNNVTDPDVAANLSSNVRTGRFVKNINSYANAIGTYFIDDMQLPNITLSGYLTLAEVIEKLQDQYGIYTYFRNRLLKEPNVLDESSELILHSGLKYFKAQYDGEISLFGSKIELPAIYGYPYIRGKKFEYNPIIDASGLEYNNFDKAKDLVIVVTSSTKQGNRRLATTTGSSFFCNFPPDIKQSNLEYIEVPNLTDKAAEAKRNEIFDSRVNARIKRISISIPNLNSDSMLKIAIDKWTSVPTTGLTGTFTVLSGIPIDRSDRIQVYFEDEINEYYAEKVEHTFDMSSGITQTVTVTTKIRSIEK